MKNHLTTLTLGLTIGLAPFALSAGPDVEMPLTQTMDENMREMAKTYMEKTGREVQMRAIDLYAMGQALMSHTGHSPCQEQGKQTIAAAKELYMASQAMTGNKEMSSKHMNELVDSWTMN